MTPPTRTPLWTARADAVRDAPLEPLAVQLGYRADPRNPNGINLELALSTSS